MPGMVPAGALTVIYGSPKAGKSALAHKIAVCVGSDSLDFDGVPVVHGRVLYVTADPGARSRHIKPRFLQIMDRLGDMTARTCIRIVDDPVILNDPASVDKLLEQNGTDFALVVIDPLYRCIDGDASTPTNMTAAVAGLVRIAMATGAAVVVLHHETKNDAHLYGSVFLQAALDSQVHVTRDDDRVTVKVELLKNDAAPERPFVYRLEAAFLDLAVGAGAFGARPAVIEHPDMLALLPTTARPVKGSRDLVEHLFAVDQSEEGRAKLWQRLRTAWEAAGLVVQERGTIRRI